MDPNAALELYRTGDADERAEAAGDLREWVRKGGFLPDWTAAEREEILGSDASRLENWLERNHTDQCDSSCCNIKAAYELGFPRLAAHLLTGATDELTAFPRGLPDYSHGEFLADCKAFNAATRQFRCDSCNSIHYEVTGASVGDSCSNCLAPGIVEIVEIGKPIPSAEDSDGNE